MSPEGELDDDAANTYEKWWEKVVGPYGGPGKTAATTMNVVVGREKPESMSKKKLGFVGLKKLSSKGRKGGGSKVVQENDGVWAVLGEAGK